jgi:hypothetical protein
MIQRCTDQNCDDFRLYGARGIAVCREWADFSVFRSWAIKSGYARGLHIDRRDNSEGYNPANCRWVVPVVNSNNTRANRLLAAFGDLLTMSQWAHDPRCVVSYETLKMRVYAGWPVETAMIIPPMKLRRKQRFAQQGDVA